MFKDEGIVILIFVFSTNDCLDSSMVLNKIIFEFSSKSI